MKNSTPLAITCAWRRCRAYNDGPENNLVFPDGAGIDSHGVRYPGNRRLCPAAPFGAQFAGPRPKKKKNPPPQNPPKRKKKPPPQKPPPPRTQKQTKKTKKDKKLTVGDGRRVGVTERWECGRTEGVLVMTVFDVVLLNSAI